MSFVAPRLAVALTTLLLTACGFALQGRVPLPAGLAVTLIATDDQQSDFVQELRRSLLASGARLTTSAQQATGEIRVEVDELQERILSVSARNIPREYELTYRVRLSVRRGGELVLATEEFLLSRDFSFDERVLLAKEREKDALSEALARDLAGIVMRRLSVI